MGDLRAATGGERPVQGRAETEIKQQQHGLQGDKKSHQTVSLNPQIPN